MILFQTKIGKLFTSKIMC